MNNEITLENLCNQNIHTIYEFVRNMDGGMSRLPELVQFGLITREQMELVRREAAILDSAQNRKEALSYGDDTRRHIG